MNNSDDAKVAEIISEKPMRYPPRTPLSNQAWKDTMVDGKLTHAARPFISAPTFETDGIVLKWVQGQPFSERIKFFGRFDAVIQGRNKTYAAKWPTALMFYKPGDYARALLEAQDD